MKYTVYYKNNTYTTHAVSATKAISNVRYRYGLLFEPMTAFRAVSADV